MINFFTRIKNAFQNKTHHHKGLPPTETFIPKEEAVAEIATTETFIPKEEAVAEIATTETSVAKGTTTKASPVRKHHHKHKDKHVAVGKHAHKHRAKSAEVSTKEFVKTTVAIAQADPIIADERLETSKEVPTIHVRAQVNAPVISPSVPNKPSAIISLFHETNASKAAKVDEIIGKRTAQEVIYAGEGKDSYGLNGRQVPPHRFTTTTKGIHYLTTQEAVAEMDDDYGIPVGKRAPQRLK